jgi:hypothetical protein
MDGRGILIFMADVWTRIAKPTGNGWISVPREGAVPYNAVTVMYNDVNWTYNGTTPFADEWVNVPKPTT